MKNRLKGYTNKKCYLRKLYVCFKNVYTILTIIANLLLAKWLSQTISWHLLHFCCILRFTGRMPVEKETKITSYNTKDISENFKGLSFMISCVIAKHLIQRTNTNLSLAEKFNDLLFVILNKIIKLVKCWEWKTSLDFFRCPWNRRKLILKYKQFWPNLMWW